MKKILAFFLICLALMIGITSCNNKSITNSGGDIIVASKNFTEQSILGELLAQQIEAKTNLKVERKPQLGGIFVCHQALIAGKIDAYIEYTGTAYNAILKQEVIADAKEIYQRVKKIYSQDFKLKVMEPLGFENTYALIVRGEDAKRYNLQKISDLAEYASQWRGGFGYEFMEREDGFPGFSKTYGIKFNKSPRIMDSGLLYRALTQQQVKVIVANSTDGQIARLGLLILDDDKQYFPPYEATPVFRQDTLKKYPQLQKAISPMLGKISAGEMQKLNYLVEGELRKVKDVVSEFRTAKGF
ncbi:glycine betaine ABC transporter substrate-binding protein [Calothrix rhizosoleniae]|uniref:glycine betaine ABC transporter substrate-binding protein n=1 Tax=Calothrix rhizosoleniae TaxID=888997 RepID=UPI000B4987C5|nr:glycine betaine ABC transporter substrate-binding protein [Calothrix rhizosoleniae]